ncbi:MAG: DUF4367 domain-containing protein [Oscillospiraceae bacterium]
MNDKISLEAILDEVCRLDFEEYAAPAPHRFSLKNRMRIRFISRKADRKLRFANNTAHKLNRRFVTAVISVIFLAAAAVSGAAAVNNGLFSFDTGLRLEIENNAGFPDRIEYGYSVSAEALGYESCAAKSDNSSFTVTYYDKEFAETACLVQYVKSAFDHSERYFNSEKIQINGHSGIYTDLSTADETISRMIWDNGDYILQLTARLPAEKAINAAQSIEIEIFMDKADPEDI